MELSEAKLPDYDIELPVLEDITFEYEPFEVELPDFGIKIPYIDFELPAFEPLPTYEF